MKKVYLVTGGTGHLGQAVIRALLDENAKVRALCLPQDKTPLPPSVEICYGDVRDKGSMARFFDVKGYDQVVLIHMAALITIESVKNEELEKINIQGTKNILALCKEHEVRRLLYVSSVHAIPENSSLGPIVEPDFFHPDRVEGHYAKSKAGAAQIVMQAIEEGLEANLIFPSGIIGPYDFNRNNHLTQLLERMARDRVFLSVRGGYDFVDVRDVAGSILLCEKHAKKGESYIISGGYYEIEDLYNIVSEVTGRKKQIVHFPIKTAELVAPMAESFAKLLGKKPLLTPYSIYTLRSNSNYSCEKAKRELNYKPRPISDTIRAMLEKR